MTPEPKTKVAPKASKVKAAAKPKAPKAKAEPKPKVQKPKTNTNRTKETAGAHETEDINFIIDAIHTKSTTGMMFINGFHTKFGATLLDARARTGSNRGTHYDFDILVGNTDGAPAWKHVEHKGANTKTAIKPDEKPWLAGVQFHNGGCDKYSITRNYAQIHYDTHIASGALTRAWSLSSPIPTFADWWKMDCCRQDDPKTPYGIELKAAVRAVRGPKGSLRPERTPVVTALPVTAAVQAQLIKEVLPIANSVLEEKDYWLTVRGSLQSGDFNHAWNPKFTIGAINTVTITKKKDIMFDFHCTDDFKFKGLMRWGKGAGFSCLRIDLK
jgi:hypothetical protein